MTFEIIHSKILQLEQLKMVSLPFFVNNKTKYFSTHYINDRYEIFTYITNHINH